MQPAGSGPADSSAGRTSRSARWGPRLGTPRWWLVIIGYLLALGGGWAYGAAIRAQGSWDAGAPWERGLLVWLHANQLEWLEGFLYLIPWAGTNFTLGPLVGITAGWLVWQRRRDLATWIVVVELGVLTLNWLVKHLLERERPDLVERIGWFGWASYPSGHAMSSLAVLMTLAALAHRARGSIWPFWAALATTAVIAYSRLVHGVHWPTDLIGGAITGAIWLAATWLAFVHLPDRKSAA